MNFADPAAVLRHIRQAADVVAHVARPDSPANRAFFRFAEDETDFPSEYLTMLEHLGVHRADYEPEIGFDDTTRERYLRIHLTAPVTVAGRVTLPAGRSVQLWRYRHRSPEELTAMMSEAGYAPLLDHRSPDGQFALIAGLRD
ncbi:hypothetical protein [Actinoplanes sp. NPDC023714]|uniref:hypothetical protein n=1 Tax=Actinoplanes sp. NPDC023714 TaxID=3154322 RepID=UPI0034027B37